MELQALLTADYLDIVFDNRNKQYGGYVLRKTYHKRMLTSIGTIVLAAGLLSAYTLLGSREDPRVAQRDPGHTEYNPTNLRFDPPKPQPKPPVNQIAGKVKMGEFTTPVIIKNDDVKEPPAELSDKVAGPRNQDGKEGDVSIVGDIDSSSAPPVVTTPAMPAAPIKFAEVMPEFNGDLNDYLGRKLMYPTIARENSIEGTVIVQFVVAEDGSVSNAKVLRSLAGGYSEEALRVVNSMPKWKPGKQNGQPVKVFYTLPIRFMLQ